MHSCVALISLSLLCGLIGGQDAPAITEMLFAGTKVGQNEYRDLGGGKFSSDSEMKIGSIVIKSKLEGQLDGEKFKELHLSEYVGQQGGEVWFKDGKITAKRGGAFVMKDREFKLPSPIYFASYHPRFNSTIFRALKPGSERQKLKVLNVSTMSAIDIICTARTGIAEVDQGKINVTYVDVSIEGQDVTLAFDLSGRALGMNVPTQTVTFQLAGYAGVFVDPVLKYKELSQPTMQTERLVRIKVPMRDGADLMTDVVKPKGDGKYPVILMRTPYGRHTDLLKGEFWAKRGYAVVGQDVRGRGGSDGVFDPLNTEVADGRDTLDWIVKQPWSNGNIGMIGASYGGLVQWAAAVNQHPALKCIIPQVSPPDPMHNMPWDHGSYLLLGTVWWARVVKDRDANMSAVSAELKNLKHLTTLPLTKVDDAVLGANVPFFDRFLKRQHLADWKGAYTMEQVSKVTIPVLHVSGIWDGDGIGTKLHWEALARNGGNQWLVFGPWNHFFNTSSKFGGVDYGPQALLELDSVYLRFYDTYLKGLDVGMGSQPRVRFFVTGANKWYEGETWPPTNSQTMTYYLAGGRANGRKSTGTLEAKPTGVKDSYVYDPAKIKFDVEGFSATQEGSTKLPPEALNSGSLLYRTAPMSGATTLAGPATIDLHVSTSAKDASFFVFLADQNPNGDLWLIGAGGGRRLTWSESGTIKVQPNKVYQIEVIPWEFAHRFEKGHRFVLLLGSDQFPRFARNPGTGEPDWKATKLVRATQTIWKGKAHPSKITMRVLP